MRYYWLKLKQDFFRDLRVKALRRSPNGETMALLYLELLLASLETGGVVPLMGVDEPAAEIALLLDAAEETAAALLAELTRLELLIRDENDDLFLPAVEALTGSESNSAPRMRRQRAKKEAADAEQPDASSAPSHCAHNVQICDTEKEIESETETEQERESEKETDLTSSESPASSAAGGIALPTNEKKKQYVVGDETIKEYGALWPELDVNAELLAMRSWLLANPGRRKSPQETPRFVNGWLGRAHEKARAAPMEPQAPPRPFAAGDPLCSPAAHTQTANRRPPSYDLQKAMEEMMTTVPKLKKKTRPVN